METTPLLDIQDLHVNVGDKPVLKGINLRINPGEVHAIFGPNGSGKTTLVNTVMGFSGYTVTEGRIIFKGQDITDLPINERARLGIGMSFQRPPVIRGVTLGQLVEASARRNGKLLDKYAAELNVGEFLPREINLGFS
ncbi:MAG: ATP-binding cassette domain-containing protein, partial [Actinobacteria bacterium]|nr:ATP-binding cassette domain-containing protein [Actinomycetota bacterium]